MATRDKDERISVPRSGAKPWDITAPRLKLALKYGIEGPEEASNRSVAFDAYALSRGPDKGPPNLADFLITQLMNSRVVSHDLNRMAGWLRLKASRDSLEQIRKHLSSANGLEELNLDALGLIGKLVDGVAYEDESRTKTEDGRRSLYGIGRAKAFKWLAAWAPAHIPMIDKVVENALVEMEGKAPWLSSEELLRRFQVQMNKNKNLDVLRSLGMWLHRRLAPELTRPLSPVRVLDSLLWCDWSVFWGPRPKGQPKPPFEEWVDADDVGRTEYGLTAKGRALNRRLNLES